MAISSRLILNRWTFSLVLAGLVAIPAAVTAKSEQAKGAQSTTLGNYLSGRHAQFESKPKKAIEHYRRALNSEPDNANLLRRIFTLSIAEGDIAEALKIARKLKSLKSGDQNLASLLLALEDIKAEKFEDAQNKISGLSQTGLNSFTLPLIKAWIQAGLKNYDDALKIISDAGSNKGLDVLFGAHSAMINALAGRNEEAEKLFKETAAKRNRINLRLTQLLGNFYERTGQAAKARDLYDAYKLDRPRTVLFDAAFKRLKETRAPLADISSAVDGAAEAMFSLAGSIRRQNSVQTILFARLAIYLKPHFSIAKLMIAETLEGDSRYQDAILLYKAIAKDPTYTRTAQLRIANNYDALDKPEDALRALRALADEDASRYDALVQMGDLLRRRKRYKEAAAAYTDAKKIIPKLTAQHWRLLYFSGIAHERVKQWDQAEADFLKALELEPGQALVLNYLGYSWVELGKNLDRARKMIETAVSKRPRDGYIIDSLGWVLYQLKDFEGAVKHMERAVVLRPEDPTINDHLGDVYWHVNRRIEARFQWQRALTLDPDEELIPKIKKKLEKGLPEI